MKTSIFSLSQPSAGCGTRLVKPAKVVLDRELVLHILNTLSHASDQGPTGRNWQSDDLRLLIDRLRDVLAGHDLAG